MEKLNYNKKELAALKNNYFMARALYETIKEAAEEIQKKVLAENEFYESEEITEMMVKRGGDGIPKRILDPNHTYMMADDDTQFQKFLDLIYLEYLKAGIADKRGRGWCPEAEAHDLYCEAEKQLVLYGIDIMPDIPEKEILRKAIKNYKYKENILDIILKLEC